MVFSVTYSLKLHNTTDLFYFILQKQMRVDIIVEFLLVMKITTNYAYTPRKREAHSGMGVPHNQLLASPSRSSASPTSHHPLTCQRTNI